MRNYSFYLFWHSVCSEKLQRKNSYHQVYGCTETSCKRTRSLSCCFTFSFVKKIEISFLARLDWILQGHWAKESTGLLLRYCRKLESMFDHLWQLHLLENNLLLLKQLKLFLLLRVPEAGTMNHMTDRGILSIDYVTKTESVTSFLFSPVIGLLLSFPCLVVYQNKYIWCWFLASSINLFHITANHSVDVFWEAWQSILFLYEYNNNLCLFSETFIASLSLAWSSWNKSPIN